MAIEKNKCVRFFSLKNWESMICDAGRVLGIGCANAD
jgi:hypothetical protein